MSLYKLGELCQNPRINLGKLVQLLQDLQSQILFLQVLLFDTNYLSQVEVSILNPSTLNFSIKRPKNIKGTNNMNIYIRKFV